jgi:hypothetical protein
VLCALHCMLGDVPVPPTAIITSDVGETETLGLAGAGGVRVEEDPNVVTGRDEGRRDSRAAEPEGLLARRGSWAQQEPVQGALVGLLHVEVTETTVTEGPVAWVGGRSSMLKNQWSA